MKTIQRYRLELVKDGMLRVAETIAGHESAAAAVLGPFFEKLPHEEVWVLLLSNRHGVRGAVRVAQGGAGGAAVVPADVLRPVIAAGAPAFIVAHNHPSGDPTPSADDVTMTRQLLAACRAVGLTLCDHLVFGAEGHYRSIRAELSEWGS